MTTAGRGGKNYQMHMSKGDRGYTVQEKRTLLPFSWVELVIKLLVQDVRQLSGENIQWYLASELRERIRARG